MVGIKERRPLTINCCYLLLLYCTKSLHFGHLSCTSASFGCSLKFQQNCSRDKTESRSRRGSLHLHSTVTPVHPYHVCIGICKNTKNTKIHIVHSSHCVARWSLQGWLLKVKKRGLPTQPALPQNSIFTVKIMKYHHVQLVHLLIMIPSYHQITNSETKSTQPPQNSTVFIFTSNILHQD